MYQLSLFYFFCNIIQQFALLFKVNSMPRSRILVLINFSIIRIFIHKIILSLMKRKKEEKKVRFFFFIWKKKIKKISILNISKRNKCFYFFCKYNLKVFFIEFFTFLFTMLIFNNNLVIVFRKLNILWLKSYKGK